MPAIAEIDGFGLRPHIAISSRSSFNEKPHAVECQGAGGIYLRLFRAPSSVPVLCALPTRRASSGLPDCSFVEFDADGTRVPKPHTRTRNGSQHLHLSAGQLPRPEPHQRVLQLGAVLSLAFGKTRRPQPTGRSAAARREADRFDNNHGRQALIAPKMKNQAKAKTSNGEEFASSMRAATKKPRKPATPSTVTARFAIASVRSLVLRPMTFPSMLTVEGWSRGHRKTSRTGRLRYRRDIEIAGGADAVTASRSA